MVTLDDETRRVLAEAKGIVAKGWCQGRAREGDRYCMLGAIAKADGAPDAALTFCIDWATPTYASARDAIGLVVDPTKAAWNDAPGRTQAEVVAAFDKVLTASVVRERESVTT